MARTPKYFIRTQQEWNSIQEIPGMKSGYTLGYHIPQPKYKTWVPNWVIRLITITQ